MKPETVEKWTHTIDTFKIIPRALILMWMYLTYSVIFWFMSLDLPTLNKLLSSALSQAHKQLAFGLFLGHSKAS